MALKHEQDTWCAGVGVIGPWKIHIVSRKWSKVDKTNGKHRTRTIQNRKKVAFSSRGSVTYADPIPFSTAESQHRQGE